MANNKAEAEIMAVSVLTFRIALGVLSRLFRHINMARKNAAQGCIQMGR